MTNSYRVMKKNQAIERINRKAKRAWLRNVGKAILTWIIWTIIFFVIGQIFIEVTMPNAVSLEAHINGPRVTFGQLLPALASISFGCYLAGICWMDRVEKLMWADREICKLKFSYMVNFNS